MPLTPNRRSLMKLTAGGIALSALQTSRVFAQPASATDAKTDFPRWRRLTLGDTRMTFISDGIPSTISTRRLEKTSPAKRSARSRTPASCRLTS